MGERLEAEEQLEGADESRGELAGSQQEGERKEFSRERRPEEAGHFEALAGEKSGSPHGFREERAQATCHRRGDRENRSNPLWLLELRPVRRSIARSGRA